MTTQKTLRLFKFGAVLVICLAILVSVSSSSSMSSTQEVQNRALRSGSTGQMLTGSLEAPKDAAGTKRFLHRLSPPVNLPGTGLLNLLTPQSPGPENIATFAEDCTTPKTDFDFGETICAKI